MKVYVLTEHDASTGQIRRIVGVFSDIDDAKDRVKGRWEFTGTHNGAPYGWYNGVHRIEDYVVEGE